MILLTFKGFKHPTSKVQENDGFSITHKVTKLLLFLNLQSVKCFFFPQYTNNDRVYVELGLTVPQKGVFHFQ